MQFPKYISFLLALLVPLTAFNQSDPDYVRFMNQGKDKLEKNDFMGAIAQFKAANISTDEPSEKAEVDDMLRKTYNAMQELSAKNAALAKDLEIKAARNLVLYDASRLSVLARLEMERGDSLEAFKHAYEATQIKGDNDMDFVTQTYGDAAYRYYRKRINLPSNGLIDLAFSPNELAIMVLGTTNQHLFVMNKTGKLLLKIQHPYMMQSAKYSKDGQMILVNASDHSASIWDTEGTILSSFEGHSQRIGTPLLSEDNQKVLTFSKDGSAILWDTSGQIAAKLVGHTKGVRKGYFSPDGTKILTVSADGSAKLWNTDGQHLSDMQHGGTWLYNAIFSPSGDRILTTAADRSPRLWDVEGNLLKTLSGHDDLATQAIYSPDGSRIFTYGAVKTGLLWDGSGNLLHQLAGHQEKITATAFSNDGTLLSTASKDGKLRLWKIDGQLVFEKDFHIMEVSGIVFSPDGSQILTSSNDKTAKLWDLRGNLLMDMDGFDSLVTSATFSANGDYLLLGLSSGDMIITPNPNIVPRLIENNPLPGSINK
ncbi:MAG: WD40 repeat domain-containing protein [Bacteroidota bacterium]